MPERIARRISNSYVLFCYDSDLSCIVSRHKVEHNLTLIAHRVGAAGQITIKLFGIPEGFAESIGLKQT